MSYHFTNTWMAITKKIVTSVDKNIKKFEPHKLLVSTQDGRAVWETVWLFLKMLNIELPMT